jgi:crossover junction endodeoxyribonuclease RuvC
MIVLGIDPGYGRLGYSVINDEGGNLVLISTGCIETHKDMPHAKRLSYIAVQIRELFERHGPERVVVEQLLFTKNQTTGLAVAEARGVVLAIAGAFDIDVIEIGPKQVKVGVTGYGDADKAQVQDMVMRILNLDAIPTPDDAADACAVAICGSGRRVD